MNANQRKILEMLAEKKISVEEAERLLSLVGKESPAESNSSQEPKSPPKYLRVVIKPKENARAEEAETVNIRVPVTLLWAGIKLASVIPSNAYSQMDSALKEKGVEFDLRNISPENLEEIIGALNDLEVDVQNGRQTVHIYAE
jgi:hypothetical protein